MKLKDIEAKSKSINDHKRKIIDIQKAFNNDSEVYAIIKKNIDENIDLLQRFNGIYKDIKKFEKEFPIESIDNIEYINGFIVDVDIFACLWDTACKEIASIQNYRNRHNVEQAEDTYSYLSTFIRKEMSYKDLKSTSSDIKKLQKLIKAIQDAFINEKEELRNILNNLESNKNQMWANDYESIKTTLTTVIYGGNYLYDIDLKKIKERISSSIRNKKKDIDTTIEKHRWLRWKKYSFFLNEIESSSIKRIRFFEKFEELRKERRIRILKTCGKIILIPILVPIIIAAGIISIWASSSSRD